jgi:hypothetical protein
VAAALARRCAGGMGSRARRFTSMDGSPGARRSGSWSDSDRSQTSIRRHQAPQRPRALEVHLTRLRLTLPRGRSAAVDGLGG